MSLLDYAALLIVLVLALSVIGAAFIFLLSPWIRPGMVQRLMLRRQELRLKRSAKTPYALFELFVFFIPSSETISEAQHSFNMEVLDALVTLSPQAHALHNLPVIEELFGDRIKLLLLLERAATAKKRQSPSEGGENSSPINTAEALDAIRTNERSLRKELRTLVEIISVLLADRHETVH